VKTPCCMSLFHNTCSFQVPYLQQSKHVHTSNRSVKTCLYFVTVSLESHWSIVNTHLIMAGLFCYNFLHTKVKNWHPSKLQSHKPYLVVELDCSLHK
jgi:hypothetical protein